MLYITPMDKWMYLIIGGVAGTVARYTVVGAAYQRIGTDFPYGTLIVNLLGCFLVGLFDVLVEKKIPMAPQLHLLLMVGFCGAFTTFSSFILDSYNLIRAGETLRAFINVVGSVALGFLVFRLGIWLGDML